MSCVMHGRSPVILPATVAERRSAAFVKRTTEVQILSVALEHWQSGRMRSVANREGLTPSEVQILDVPLTPQ